MDHVRNLLGEKKISYLGYSYGSYLGAVYSQMFPGRLDRVVFDGALDPRRYNPRLMRGAEAVNDAALRSWAAWTAKRHRTYRLGRTADEVLSTTTGIIEAASRKPLRIGKSTLDDTQVAVIPIIFVSDDRPKVKAALSTQISLLKRAAAGKNVKPNDALKETIATLTTGGRRPGSAAAAAGRCARPASGGAADASPVRRVGALARVRRGQ